MSSEPITGRSHRPRSRRWIATAAALVVGACAIGLIYRRYADPERVRRIAQAYLQRFVAGEVEIGSARFSVLGGLRLFDVRISDSTAPLAADSGVSDPAPGEGADPRGPRDRRIFSCREIEVTHDPFSMLAGRLRVETLLALEPSCVIVHDRATGRTNLAGMWSTDAPAGAAVPDTLPTIELRRARVRVRSRERDRERDVEDLTLTLRGRSAADDPRLYDIVWHEPDGDDGGGHSQIDLRTGYLRNVRGGLPRMSIEAVMLAVNAGYDGTAAWSELLGLDGTVRATDYNLIGDSDVHGPRSATIELSDASISIPIDAAEQRFRRSQRYLRMTGVHGSVGVRSDRIDASFVGDLHGSRCAVAGQVSFDAGRPLSLDDVNFDAHLSVTNLQLPGVDASAPPEQARFVNHWAQLAAFFEDYHPTGHADVDIGVSKRAGGPIQLRRAVLTGRGGEALCRFFPYPVYNVSGTVEFSPDGIFVRDVRGQREGGVVTLSGWGDEPSACAAAELVVRGEGVLLDETLFAAIPGNYRASIDPFHPTGRADFEVKLSRARCVEGQPAPWRPETTIAFDDVAATYAGFPYRVDRWSGEVRCADRQVELRGVMGHRGDTTIGIDGAVSYTDGEPSSLNLSVDAAHVPIDDELMRALPSDLRETVAAFSPEGVIDVATTLALSEPGRTLTHDTVVTMRDVAVRYAALPIPITNLGGNLRLTRGRLAFEGVSGRCAGGSLRVGGWVDRGQSRRTGEIDIAFSQLRADDAFHDALPPGWRDRIGAFRVRGPIDGSVRATTDTDEDDLHWAVTANALLVDVDVEHPFVPLPLRGVRGSVDFADGRVRCDRLDARYDRAALRASFSIETSPEGPVGEVSLSATDLPLDRATRDLGPPQLRAVWDRIEPVGAVDLDIASLRVEPVEPDGAQRWIVDGAAQLHDVTLRGVEGVDGLTGRVVAQGMAVDRLGGTALAGRLTNARARVRGRELDHVDADWSLLRTTDGGGRLALTNAQAELYDGSVSGGAELLFDTESARYNLSTTMQGVRLRPLLVRVGGAVDDRATTGPADAMEVDGSVDAHAYLSGELGRPASRRGGGRVEIVDGHLYHLPIVVAILHVLNLSLPRQGALEEAEASFFLVGDRCDLQDIRLRGDDLALVGHGTMSLPDLGVDLRLINVGPRDWVRLPALADFVDGVSRRLLELQITGPIDRPTVRTQALRAIGDEFKRLFNKRRPPKVQRVSK